MASAAAKRAKATRDKGEFALRLARHGCPEDVGGKLPCLDTWRSVRIGTSRKGRKVRILGMTCLHGHRVEGKYRKLVNPIEGEA